MVRSARRARTNPRLPGGSVVAVVAGKKIDATKMRTSEWGDDFAALYAVPADVTDVEITAEPSVVVTPNWGGQRRTVGFRADDGQGRLP